MLHADERCAVAALAQEVRHVFLARVEAPAEGRVGQAHHARRVRVPTGVQRRAAGAALGRGAEARGEADPARGEAIQGRRRDRRLPVAAQVLPEIVAGEEENACRQVRVSP